MPPSKRKDQQSDDEDYSQDQEVDDQDKVMTKKPKVQRLDNMKNLKKIVINVSMTQYPVIIEVAEQLGWKIQYNLDSGDWDILWTDWHIQPDILIKMHLFQKISHFPGIHTLARKNLLGLHLMSMRQAFPQQYDFFPLTWMLPQQYVQFRTYFQSKPKGKARTYIVKPEADCQGRGIFLTRKLQSIENGKHYVVQRYISRPYLIDNLKFDLRIYVLIASVNPLRIYLFEDGLARFATQNYIEPTANNLQKQYMHLTNYAINKKNPKFIFNNNASNMGIGHKRSLKCVFQQLQSKGVDISQLKTKIKDMIIKTIITGYPLMSHQYKCSQPQDYTGNMCFHILGFDVMMKSNGDPVLLEVNHTPSFTTDTPLDLKIKKALIKDTLKIMNVNLKKKTQLYNLSMENNQARLLTGKRNILEGKQREQLIEKHQRQRQQYQKNNLGGYEVIYPIKDQDRMNVYKKLIDHSSKHYFQEKGSIRMKMAEKQAKRLARQEYKQLKKNKFQQSQNQKILTQKNVRTKQQTKQSTHQTSQNNEGSNRIYKKGSTPFSQNDISIEEKIRTIDNGEIYMKADILKKDKRISYNNNTPNLKYSMRQGKNISQKIITEQINPPKTSKSIKNDELRMAQTRQIRAQTPIKSIAQKISQLPLIIDNTSQLLQKSNLIKGSQYDRRRYIKGPSTNMERSIVQRSISGKTYNMTKSTSAVNQQKQEFNVRQNLSSVMARKRLQQKLNSKKKISQQTPFNQVKQQGTKIMYNAFQSNYNPNFADLQVNGGYVMPKIFCLNFEAEKNTNENLKFLMFRNFENPSK